MASLNYRLFFDESELSAIRQRYSGEAIFEELREELDGFDRKEEHRFLKEELNTNYQLTHLQRLCNTTDKMAFHYLMTGEVASAELAVECVRSILKFRFWDFFLSGEEVMGVQRAPAATVSIALAGDWLGDFVSVEERQGWITAMGTEGAEPCYRGIRDVRYPRKAPLWRINPEAGLLQERPDAGGRHAMIRRPEITHNTNLRAVPASALAFGVCAMEAEFGASETTERWKEMALHNIRVFGEVWEADGSYHEAVNYGNYTAMHLLQAVMLFRRKGVTDLEDLINWGGFARFLWHMGCPTDLDDCGIINFGDSGNFPPTAGSSKQVARRQSVSMVPFFAGSEFGDKVAQWIGTHLPSAQNFWAVLCYDPSVGEEEPELGPQVWRCDLDWIVAREGWKTEDLVLGFRSGVPGNHEHADRNSFLLKGFGEMLVADPFRPPYSCYDSSWPLRTTAGHSAILIDGEGHGFVNGSEGTNASYAKARIVHHRLKDGVATWLSDATQAYRLNNLDVQAVNRAVAVFLKEKIVVLVDRVEKMKESSEVEARFFAYNNDGNAQLSTLDNEFWITRPSAYLRGNVYSNLRFHGRTDQMPIDPEEARKHPFVAFRSEASQVVTLVTVLVCGKSEDTPSAVLCSVDGEKFHLTLEEREVRIDGLEVVVG